MKVLLLSLSILLSSTCNHKVDAPDPASHYRKYQDFASLKAAFELIPKEADTTILKEVLGTPIDFGFDYRYFANDTIGPKGCPVGAIFWIDKGKVIGREIFEVCE